jgi:outer membrane immunogenic protein
MKTYIYTGLGVALALSAAAVLIPGASVAADLGSGSYKDIPAPPAWRGFYFGVDAGGVVQGESAFTFNPGGPGEAGRTNGVDMKGAAGGFHMGYNAQFGMIVAGIEGDANFAKTGSPTWAAFKGGVAESQVAGVYSARGRLGVTLRPNILAYGTGGIALASVDHSLDFGGEVYKDSGTVAGAVYGGGLEYLHSSRLSFGIEALHYDFGTDRFNLNTTLPEASQNNIPTDINTNFTTVRGRISLHLD